MRVLVTGATGFIGGALTRRLVNDGWEVRGLVRDPARAAHLAAAGASLVPGDVERPGTLGPAVAGCDAVVHAAARVDVVTPRRKDLLRTNVDGTRNVLEACQRAAVPRVLYLSSVAALGRSHPVADETLWHEGPYASPYEESKRRAELVALEFGRAGLPVVHALPSVVVGPGDPKTGEFFRRYLLGRIPALPSRDGSINFVHIDDLVDGLMRCLERGRPNERYIFNQATWTTSQFLAELEAASGVPPPRRWPLALLLPLAALEQARAALTRSRPRVTPRAVRLATRRYAYSSERARRELGWAPHDFRERFRDTVRYWQREVGIAA